LLNHAITYVPSLDLYLDSTATPIAAGYLPIPELGKPVVLTQSGKLARTPSRQLSQVDGALVFKINPQGAADFTNDNTVQGWGTEFNRFLFKSMTPTDRSQLTQKVLSMYGQTGSGEIETDPLDSNAPTFKSTVTGRTENLVNLPGPTGVPTLSSLAGGIGQNVFSFLSEKDRTQSFSCASGTIKETARFDFPKEVNILAVPKGASLDQQSTDDVALQETFETALRKLLGEYNMNLGDVVSILDLSRIAKTVSTKRTVRRA
jgi:hypothetical protein